MNAARLYNKKRKMHIKSLRKLTQYHVSIITLLITAVYENTKSGEWISINDLYEVFELGETIEGMDIHLMQGLLNKIEWIFLFDRKEENGTVFYQFNPTLQGLTKNKR